MVGDFYLYRSYCNYASRHRHAPVHFRLCCWFRERLRPRILKIKLRSKRITPIPDQEVFKRKIGAEKGVRAKPTIFRPPSATPPAPLAHLGSPLPFYSKRTNTVFTTYGLGDFIGRRFSLGHEWLDWRPSLIIRRQACPSKVAGA